MNYRNTVIHAILTIEVQRKMETVVVKRIWKRSIKKKQFTLH